MALKLRPTGLGSGIDKDRADYFFLAKISLIKPFFRACVRTWFIRLDASTPSRPTWPAVKAEISCLLRTLALQDWLL